MFLIALWVLFFVTDDFVENDILNKKNDLQSKASFMGKIARPAFENNKVSDFQLMLEMYDLFDDPQLLPVHKIKIYLFFNNAKFSIFSTFFFNFITKQK